MFKDMSLIILANPRALIFMSFTEVLILVSLQALTAVARVMNPI